MIPPNSEGQKNVKKVALVCRADEVIRAELAYVVLNSCGVLPCIQFAIFATN
jgi:hypothetical protein